ncbi:MAG TPA: hypothetical protein VFV17_05900, partial [Usitatibacteraceae bacterium]|nr:hypothetical protein [Usitatibacteraceae bacterium]
MAAALLLAACGSGAGGGDGQSAASTVAPAAPLAADVTILFMGNSHTAFHDVPGTVVKLMRGAEPSRTVAALTSPDWMHLDERGEH